MDTLATQQEEKNKKRGMIVSMIVHILLILLALWPFLELPDPPPGQEGILVNLGLPDVGEGEENAGPSEPVVAEEQEQEEEAAEEVPEDDPVEEPVEEEPQETEPTPDREVITDDAPDEVALKKAAEEKKKQQEAREKAERERKERERKEKERKEREAEEARKKAEADKLKNEIGGLFGDGDGKGNTGKPGNQGDPDGDPDASKLDGISTGSGQVGGGLSDRGVVRSHTPTDNSQETGTVVVEVCVNESGGVISAKVTQKGTTSSSSTLRNLAVASAKKWRFKEGVVDKQCGTITYNFRLK